MAWPPETSGGGTSVIGPVSVQSIRKVTASGAILLTDATLMVDATLGPITLTLPSASSCKGQRFTFKKVSAEGNVFTLNGAMIDGDPAGVQLMAQYEAVAVVSDGAVYYVLYRG